MAGATAIGRQEGQVLRRFINAIVQGRARGGRRAVVPNTLHPDVPFTAIGDIHGRYDLLDTLLSMIDPGEDQRLVFLGDYVDRGPDAAKALARLHKMSVSRPDTVVCLMGNHEKMLLQFLDDPLTNGPLWLRNGGVATLASYGITCDTDQVDADQLMALSDALEAVMSPQVVTWLRQRPLSWHSGNIWCVHAAMDPRIPPDQQPRRNLLWGHADFLKRPRADGLCVVHGHTRVAQPSNQNSRVAIDTGAYETGRLTAAAIAPGRCSFIQAGPAA